MENLVRVYLKMNPQKAYVISQRLTYLALGSVIGYFLAKNEAPLDFYLVLGFVILALGLSWWIGRKSKPL